jgi:8-oxo-dGTP pyrophosphatase MutT (NUDIX family)
LIKILGIEKMKSKKQRVHNSGTFIINDHSEVLVLYRRNHDRYETPGGKPNPGECKTPSRPTIGELEKIALRETTEELGKGIRLKETQYIGNVEFYRTDGKRMKVAKFFTTLASGIPKVGEPDTFSHMRYIPIDKLHKYSLAKDLRLFIPKLKMFYSKMYAET